MSRSLLGSLGETTAKVAVRAIPLYFGIQLAKYLANAADLGSVSTELKAAYGLAGLLIGRSYSRPAGQLGYQIGAGIGMVGISIDNFITEALKETIERL